MADARHRPTPLGASGLKVSKLWLGAMMFGDQTGEAEAGRIVAAARDAGVNAIDTADAYAGGESERITGRLIAADRERWVLATKLANPTSSDPNDRGLSRRHMIRALDASLEAPRHRLGRHPLPAPRRRDDTARGNRRGDGAPALDRQGALLRRLELSRLARRPHGRDLPRRERSGADRLPAALQRHDARAIETELLPCCAHYGLGVVAYSPLARGVLTGKYAPGTPPPEGSRAGRNDERILQTEFRAGVARARPAHRRARQVARHDAAAVRARLGLEQRARPRRDRRAEDAGAVAGVHRRDRPPSSMPPTRRWSIRWSRPGTRRRPATPIRSIR